MTLEFIFGGLILFVLISLVCALIKESIADFKYYRDKYFKKK